MENGRVLGPDEDPIEAVRRYAVQAADESDRFAIQLSDTEWLLVPAFDMVWTTEDGDTIDVQLEVPNISD